MPTKLALSLGLIVAVAGCKEGASETDGRRPRPGEQVVAPPVEPGRFWERPESFSILAFRGDLRAPFRGLLPQMGYTVQAEERVSAPARDINARIRPTADGTMKKALWFAGGFTVVLDPEMVMTEEAALDAFCRDNATSMIAATWERVSQSVIAVELSATGERTSSYLVSGEVAEGAPQPAHSILVAKPDLDGLRELLAAAGLPLNEALGSVDATILTVTE